MQMIIRIAKAVARRLPRLGNAERDASIEALLAASVFQIETLQAAASLAAARHHEIMEAVTSLRAELATLQAAAEQQHLDDLAALPDEARCRAA